MRSFILGLAIACFGVLGLPQAQAADKPNLLVFGEDFDDDAIPRDSRVFRRVLTSLQEQLSDKGFDVFDETAVTLDNFAQGRTGRSDAEIIDIAKSITRPPIDVATIFTIYASARDVGHTTKVRVRIEGRLLQVKTGQHLGAFEVKGPPEWNAPAKCNRECIIESVGDYAKTLGNDLGSVLAEKLAWLVEGHTGTVSNTGSALPTAYNLVFDGFTPDEMLKIEEYMTIFSGYKTHRPGYSSNTRAEIWYESSIASARLNRNIQRMLAELDLRGTVQFSGNTFTLKKITLRGQQKKPAASEGW